MWPLESYDGGSHIGLMQVPLSMHNAWNWEKNTEKGADIFYQKDPECYENYASYHEVVSWVTRIVWCATGKYGIGFVQ